MALKHGVSVKGWNTANPITSTRAPVKCRRAMAALEVLCVATDPGIYTDHVWTAEGAPAVFATARAGEERVMPQNEFRQSSKAGNRDSQRLSAPSARPASQYAGFAEECTAPLLQHGGKALDHEHSCNQTLPPNQTARTKDASSQWNPYCNLEAQRREVAANHYVPPDRRTTTSSQGLPGQERLEGNCQAGNRMEWYNRKRYTDSECDMLRSWTARNKLHDMPGTEPEAAALQSEKRPKPKEGRRPAKYQPWQ